MSRRHNIYSMGLGGLILVLGVMTLTLGATVGVGGELLENVTMAIDGAMCVDSNCSLLILNTTAPTPNITTEAACANYSNGWGLKGSDWGCCGNYDGCCTYASLICYFHDAMCRCCDVTTFCGPACKPEPDCDGYKDGNITDINVTPSNVNVFKDRPEAEIGEDKKNNDKNGFKHKEPDDKVNYKEKNGTKHKEPGDKVNYQKKNGTKNKEPGDKVNYKEKNDTKHKEPGDKVNYKEKNGTKFKEPGDKVNYQKKNGTKNIEPGDKVSYQEKNGTKNKEPGDKVNYQEKNGTKNIESGDKVNYQEKNGTKLNALVKHSYSNKHYKNVTKSGMEDISMEFNERNGTENQTAQVASSSLESEQDDYLNIEALERALNDTKADEMDVFEDFDLEIEKLLNETESLLSIHNELFEEHGSGESDFKVEM